jgi:hypothetical protein
LIIERYYYVMFKIVKEYPDTKLFTVAIDGILAMAHKIEAKMLVSIVDAMQSSQQMMEEIMADMASKEKGKKGSVSNHPGFVALMKKRLATIFSSIEISTKANFLEEMEEKGSLTSLYRLIQDIVKYDFNLEHFEEIKRVKLVSLLEKLFLVRRHVSLECMAAFIKLLARLLITPLVPDRGFVIAVLTFCYLVTHKFQKLRNLLDEDNEGFGLNVYDPHINDPYSCNGLHTSITEELKLISSRDGEGSLKKVIDRLVKRLPPTPEQLTRRPSTQYAESLQVVFVDTETVPPPRSQHHFDEGPEEDEEEGESAPHQRQFGRDNRRGKFEGKRGGDRKSFGNRHREDDEQEDRHEDKYDRDEDDDGTRKYFDRKNKEPRQAHYQRQFKKRDDSDHQQRSFSHKKRGGHQKGQQRPMKFMSKKEANRSFSRGSRR